MLAAFSDVDGIVVIAVVAECAKHRVFHHIRKADDGIQRGAQFMTHVGKKIHLGQIGAFRHGFLLKIAFRELGELLGLGLQRLAGFLQR